MEVNLIRKVIKVVDRINYKSTKFSIFLSVLISASIFTIAFKVVLSTPGFIEYKDATFHYKSSHHTAKYLHTWNPYKSSDNFPYLNQFPMYFWWSLIENTELETRLLYFIIFVLIGTIIFLTVFSWLKERYENVIPCYVASIAALFIYMVNPWVTFHISHPEYLWSYAFTPLTFYFTHKAVNQVSIKGWLKYSLLLSLVLFLTTISYVGIVTNIVLFAFTLVRLAMTALKTEHLLPQAEQEQSQEWPECPDEPTAARPWCYNCTWTGINKGCQSEKVEEWQEQLNSLDCNCGTIDGKFGPSTRDCTIRFQKANNLTPDGMVGNPCICREELPRDIGILFS